MATVTKWTPFGVALDITATAGTVTRTSATQYKVVIKASWACSSSSNKTDYGMTASSGGGSVTLNEEGTKSNGSTEKTFTGTYSISGNGSATKTVTVTFKNFNTWHDDEATKTVSFNVTVPAWTSYVVTYNANGGSGAPSYQTKWSGQTLTLSSTKPTRTGYSFLGWSTSSTATTATYSAGGNFTSNANTTLYAVWKANTYTVSYNANGGTGAPASQTKTYGKTLTLSSTKPTRTNYTFKGWGVAASSTTIAYAAGASYTENASITLYAIWSLSYTKPRITNFSVARCNSSGTASNTGLYALVKFDWDTDTTVEKVEIVVNYKTYTATASGTSGSVSKVVGAGALNANTSYRVIARVKDTNDITAVSKTLRSQRYAFDALPENKGVAFGKAAEFEDMAEFAYDAKFNNPVYGKALGLDKLPAVIEYASFNDSEYLEPGCYAVHSNALAKNIYNMPVQVAGRLEVWSATGEGVRTSQWSYLRQRFIPYNQTNAVWERDVTRNENNAWTFYDWWQSSLTPDAADKVYNKSAITVALTANVTSLITQAYTKVAFNKSVSSMGNKLSLSDNSILIGPGVDYVKASAQILLKCLTDGSKHFKINKVSNGTTTCWSWTCQEADRYENSSGTSQATGFEFCLTPIIIPVAEGDLITCTYYTSNSTDYIVAGSSANGYQTYFTVEEL